MAIDRDKNLLFGIFAAQLRGVRAERIIEAGAAWATDPSRSLAERLLELGAINSSDHELLDRLVAEAIRAHGGDASQALSRWGGVEQAERAFSGSLRMTPGGSVLTVPMDKSSPASRVLSDLNVPEETPGRYSRISVYGKGGMGRVLLVHDEHMDRDIAMKELLPHPEQKSSGGWTPVGHTAAMVARFLREARLTGLLEHPSIIPVYELGRREDGSLYYTMKLVRGKTLLQAIRAEKLIEGRLRLLPHFLDLCQAIAYAHSRGVIHRDIKPANVMIGDFGETVVLDWGIAKSQGSQDIHETEMAEALTALKLDDQEFDVETRQGEALGTPHYMPPEQAQGRVFDIDKRSDVYSLGAVLYEMLTAKTPYTGRTTREILQHVIKDQYARVNTIVSDVPPELAAIAEKCLEKDPAARYQSAKELADDVQRFLSGALVKSFKYNPGQVLRHYYRRHRAVLNTAFTGILALLALGVYSYVNITRAYHNEQEQRQLAENARDEAETARAQEQSAREAAVLAGEAEKTSKEAAERQLYLSNILVARQSIEQRRYDVAIQALESAPAAYRHWEWGYYNRLCHLDEFTLKGHDGRIYWAEYSPDGTKIVTASADKTARIWDSSTGQCLAVLAGHTDQLVTAHFSPDGKFLATASEDGTARLWDGDSGHEIRTITTEPIPLHDAKFSSDGTLLLSFTNEIVVVTDLQRNVHARIEDAGKGIKNAFLADSNQTVLLLTWNTIQAWNLESSRQIISTPVSQTIRGAAFHTSGLLFWTENTAYLLKDWRNPGPVAVWTSANEKISYCGFETPGMKIFIGTSRALHILNPLDTTDVHTIVLEARVEQITPPNIAGICSVGLADNRTVVLDAEYSIAGELLGHSASVQSVAASPDGVHMVTGSLDGTAKIWKLDELFSGHKKKLHNTASPILSIALSPDRRHLAVTHTQPVSHIWDLETGKIVTSLRQSSSSLVCASFSPKGTQLLTGSHDGTATIWDAGSGNPQVNLMDHRNIVVGVEWNPKQESVLTCSEDGLAITWDPSTGKIRQRFQHSQAILSAHFSPDGLRVLTTSRDATAAIWDAETGREMNKLQGHSGPVLNAVWSPDQQFVLTVSTDKTAILWDAETGQPVHRLSGHQDLLNGAIFSSKGDTFLTWSQDGTVRHWRTATGECITTLRASDVFVAGASFSKDEQRILTAGGIDSLRLWDVESGKQVAELPIVATSIKTAFFAADETIFAAADDSVLVFGSQ